MVVLAAVVLVVTEAAVMLIRDRQSLVDFAIARGRDNGSSIIVPLGINVAVRRSRRHRRRVHGRNGAGGAGCRGKVVRRVAIADANDCLHRTVLVGKVTHIVHIGYTAVAVDTRRHKLKVIRLSGGDSIDRRRPRPLDHGQLTPAATFHRCGRTTAAHRRLLGVAGQDDVHLAAAVPEEVPGLLHGEAAEAGPVHIDYLIAQHKPPVPART